MISAELRRRSAGVWQLALLASVIVAVACVPQVTVTPLGPAKHFDPTPDSMAIPLYTTAKPECPYDEIAAISAEITAGRGSDDKVTDAVRQRAREIGAQAIIGYAQGSRDVTVARGEGATSLTRSGTAIRFRSRDCMR